MFQVLKMVNFKTIWIMKKEIRDIWSKTQCNKKWLRLLVISKWRIIIFIHTLRRSQCNKYHSLIIMPAAGIHCLHLKSFTLMIHSSWVREEWSIKWLLKWTTSNTSSNQRHQQCIHHQATTRQQATLSRLLIPTTGKGIPHPRGLLTPIKAATSSICPPASTNSNSKIYHLLWQRI